MNCSATTDSARCCKELGHDGYHQDGGCIWSLTAEELAGKRATEMDSLRSARDEWKRRAESAEARLAYREPAGLEALRAERDALRNELAAGKSLREVDLTAHVMDLTQERDAMREAIREAIRILDSVLSHRTSHADFNAVLLGLHQFVTEKK